MVWGKTIQVFAIGTDGLMQNFSYDPSNCTNGLKGWCAPWAMPQGAVRLGPSSGVAVMPWNNNTTIQLFAVGSDGLMQNYSYSPSNASCTSRGWCAPWSMPEGSLPALSASSGVAAIPWYNTIQLFAITANYNGPKVQNFSYNPVNCTSGLYGWCAPWLM